MVPILIGMAGVLFSQQFDNVGFRFSVVLLSVGVPLFAGGNFLARRHVQGIEKLVMIAGVFLLLLGAAASIATFRETLVEQQAFPKNVTDISRWLGMFSLALGLFVVLVSVVRAGRAAEEIGERFRQLADQINEGFVLSLPDETIVLVNQRLLDMLDLTEDEVVGENSRSLAARLGAAVMVPHIDIRAKGLASEYELTFRVRGEERQFWISGSPVFDRRGRYTGVLATFRDVTERNRLAKRAERYAQALQQLVEDQRQKLILSEERFRNLLLHMNEGFLTIDSSFRIQFANNRICEFLHVGAGAILGRALFDFIAPSDRVKLMELLQAARTDQDPAVLPELHFVCATETVVPAVVAVALVREASSADHSYSIAITDVSALKQMQHELEERAWELEVANEELKVLGRAKDSFLSNVSHELRTPLSTINGYLEMLESSGLGQLQGPQLSALNVMKRNARRLASLINEMIEFSRMAIRGVQLKVALFGPGELVREAAASAQPQILAKDLSVNIFARDGFPPVWGDAEKIGQVLGILVSNAVKFSEEGGMIQLRVDERTDHTVAITVSDTGIGIDPKFHARIFEKFYQVDSSMTRHYEGTGIGLSIARSIVDAHGGTIELKSDVGKGSAFTVVLPHAVFDKDVTAEHCENLASLTLLVAAEDETFRDAVAQVLMACGCTVDKAVNGYECVRMAEESQPDLILFDEVLSEAGGPSALSNLRQNPATDQIPVILLTGEEASKLRGADRMSQRVHIVPKPFAARQLLSEVHRVCFGETTDYGLTPSSGPLAASPRVIVVDPDGELIEWLELALEHKRVTCYGVSEPAQALQLAEQEPPDVLFLNIDASVGTPARMVSQFREAPVTQDVPLYVMTGLSTYQDPSDGVAGTLKMPFTADEVIAIIRRVRAQQVEAAP